MRNVLLVYGIHHCDTVAAACKWLEQRGVPFDFRDLRKDHPDARTLENWLERLGRDRLLNKTSATWRTLDSSSENSFAPRGGDCPASRSEST